MNDMSADNIIKVLNKTVSVKESRFFSNIFPERKIFQDILVCKYSKQHKLWWSALYLSNDIMTLDRSLPYFEKRCRIYHINSSKVVLYYTDRIRACLASVQKYKKVVYYN